MTATDVALAGTLMLLVGAAIVLGAAEAALLRVSRVRVEIRAADGDRRSERLLRLLSDLPRVLNTVLLAVLLVQIGAATVTGTLAGRYFGNVGVTVASVALTIVLFVYAEAIPKTYAVRHPLGVASATTPLLALLTWMLRPLVTVLVAFADLQAPETGIAGSSAVTEQELRLLASEAVTTGTIEPMDRDLMERAFELGDRTADDILVPRTEIVAVEAMTPISEALDVAVASGHRRIPIYDGDLDHIRGVARLRDLADAIRTTPDAPVGSVATPELIVPETKPVVDVLADMQRAAIHVAVVIDEFGGTAGIVTIEDVVSELVGRVSDEGEASPSTIRVIAPGVWHLDAAATVQDVEAATGAMLPDGDWHTIGGLIAGVAGRIPQRGDRFPFDGLTIEIVDAAPHRVLTLQARRADHEPSS